MALTHTAHCLITAHFADKPRGVAVDATLGNGHDAAFLLGLDFHQVIGFDVQARALENTRQRLSDERLKTLTLVLDGHQHIEQYVSEPIDCVMFNFGYLPGGDKNNTTQSDTSITAIQRASKLLSQHGLITLLCYPGHTEGAVEHTTIKELLKSYNNDWHVDTHLSNAPNSTSPILYTLKRASIQRT